MRTRFQQKSAFALLAAVGGLLTAINFASAQPLQPEVLFSFTNGPAQPYGALVQGNDGSFYGTSDGGGPGNGTVFRVTTNGEWTTLVPFDFKGGAYPHANLTLGSDGNFYGTTTVGGDLSLNGGYGLGTAFRMTPAGVLTTLVSFHGTNGASPNGLTLGSDGNFYGTTSGESSYGFGYGGTVFKVTTNGALTTLVSFAWTNGANPYAGLTLGGDGNFYGTTYQGGDYGAGTVFQMTTNGVLTTLVSFDGTNGYYPSADLTLGSDGNFYGTTSGLWEGLDVGYGTVFRVTTNGFLTTLVSFAWTNGAHPYAGLTLGSDGSFYGTTSEGGYTDQLGNSLGTVFRVTTNGVLTTLVSFAGTNGANPARGLTLGNDGNFYGTTSGGGSARKGAVFQISPTGVLTTLTSLASRDGHFPFGDLTLGSDGILYGTTFAGGPSDYGTLFQVTTSGALTTLASFAGTNGAYPDSALTLGPDGNLYGTLSRRTTSDGTEVVYEMVFRVTTNGVLTNLVSFYPANGFGPNSLTLGNDDNFYVTTAAGGSANSGAVFRVTTNGVLIALASFGGMNGAIPFAAMTLGNDGNFYGTTFYDSYVFDSAYGLYRGYGYGTVFKVTTNGVLTRLASFAGTNGAWSKSALTLGSDGSLYGTTSEGGITNSAHPDGSGTVFTITTNGVLTTLVSFNGTNGAYPRAGLTLGSDGNFYGTTVNGEGVAGAGTVFQITTNGMLTTLLSFNMKDGANPYAGLTLGSDGNFYSTTSSGGPGGGGVIYRLRHGVSIQSFGMTTNGFQLNTLNVGGSGWVVLESSSDLSIWTPIQTNGTAAAQTFLDPAALTRPRQFYRVRQQ